MNLHNDPTQAKAYTRRAFLQNSALLASAALTVPAFIQSSAMALPTAEAGLSSIAGVNEDNILVIIQLSGGNDGLNTVVPYRDDAYYRLRPSIGIRPDGLHILSKNGSNGAADLGLNEAMTGIRELYDEGSCAIVQGVGYPNPNRSHFASMDIWHTGELSGTGDGWLGRYIDAQCCGYGKGESGRPDGSVDEQARVEPPIAIGSESPLMLSGRNMMPVSFESADLFDWAGKKYSEDIVEEHRKLTDMINKRVEEEKDSNNAFLLRTAMDARVSSDAIRRAVSAKPLVNYPGNPLAQQLSMIGSMIRAGLKTRVYYASIGSFDTHANQPGSHARLLGQFSSAVRAFQQDLQAQGNDGRVMTMAFSEFGRRVGQNASNGTDHGTAAPMFMFGSKVKGGFHSRHPSLTSLDSGDLKYTADFRSVYAEVLDNWLSTKSEDVLDGKFKHLRVLDA
ncbi:MAG: twin-arginine translocation pathway signal protein [Phycisphaerae bacterium]|nr:twin-arginine translocation pathway signal protein [Phycisphaerae bacterium]MBM91201.1 twin-arginine translocation pathway signal protein [Phycisphaerae bacterium]HCT45343.1 twin-arginine translocation pathway signal protein [Phycisphaerales bacterium]